MPVTWENAEDNYFLPASEVRRGFRTKANASSFE